jgi:hypothetical protein
MRQARHTKVFWLRLLYRKWHDYPISSPISDFSSFNSATDVLIFARLNSLIGSFSTISHLPIGQPARNATTRDTLEITERIGICHR